MAENDISENKEKEFTKYIILTLASMVIMFIVFAGVNYFIMENLINQKMNATQLTNEELADDEGDGDEIQKGIIVDLGDFILNLCDENQKKYLKVNVAIEVSRKDTDFAAPSNKAAKGGHGHEEIAEAPSDPLVAIQNEMNQYKPAIRDAVITNLSSKTSSELATAAGKELAKEQISNDINSILGGEREVLRVSFGQFIIQ